MSKPQLLFFYSNKCEHSGKALQYLSNSPLQSRVLKVCIDDRRYAVPDYTHSVPSLLNRITKQVYVGEAVLALFRANTGLPSSQQTNNRVQRPPPLPLSDVAPSQSSFGEMFSDLKDTPVASTLDSSFQPLMNPQDLARYESAGQAPKGGFDDVLARMVEARQSDTPVQKRQC